MKQLSKISALLILLGGFATAVIAQPVGNVQQQKRQNKSAQLERPYNMIPDLTDAQKEQMKDIHFNTMKQVQPMKNQLREKRTHLKTLTTAEKADLKVINNQIDEIAKLEASIQKIQAASHQGVRNILTDEQRLIFDAHSDRRMGENSPGFGPGNGRGGQGAGHRQGARGNNHCLNN